MVGAMGGTAMNMREMLRARESARPSMGAGWLRAAVHACACVALLAAGWAAWRVAAAADRIAWAAEELPVLVGDVVRHEAGEVRALAAVESRAWRGAVDRAARRSEAALRAESGAWRAAARAAADDAVARLDARAAAAVGAVEGPSLAAAALIEEYRRLPAIVGERLDPWTDCRGNGACWQAQATALLGATRATAGETSRAMRTIREATPAIVGNVDRVTENVVKMTKPDSLKWRIIKAVAPVAGGIVFGSIK